MRRGACALGLVVSVIGTLVGCHAEGVLTEVVVAVDTNLRVPFELDAVEVEVRTPEGDTLLAQGALMGVESLPATVALRWRRGARAGVRIVARGKFGEEVRVSRVAVVDLEEGAWRLLKLDLSSACVGFECPEGETCSPNGCVSTTVGSEDLEDFDGTAPARFAAPPPCTCVDPTSACRFTDRGAECVSPARGCATGTACGDGYLCRPEESECVCSRVDLCGVTCTIGRADCPGEMRCVDGPGGGRCVEAYACVSDASCETSQRCGFDGRGRRCIAPGSEPVGSPCLVAAECASAHCIEGYCSEPCATHGDCAGGGGSRRCVLRGARACFAPAETCQGNACFASDEACTPGDAMGDCVAPCARGADCAAGDCAFDSLALGRCDATKECSDDEIEIGGRCMREEACHVAPMACGGASTRDCLSLAELGLGGSASVGLCKARPPS